MNLDDMNRAADEASELLKALSNRHRLIIVCQLIERERSVGELAAVLGVRDSTVSQHLALLRREGLVTARRDGQTIWYRIGSQPVRELVTTLYRILLPTGGGMRTPRASARKTGQDAQARCGRSMMALAIWLTVAPTEAARGRNMTAMSRHVVMLIAAVGFVLSPVVSIAVAQNALPGAGSSAEAITVEPIKVSDEKAVFATVESANVVPARARIGGTVVTLAVKEGNRVERGQVLATVGDEKIALNIKSLDAQISGLEAQRAQAQTDFDRADSLFARGIVPRTRLDEARTKLNVSENAYRSRVAERSVLAQQISEGNVLAPTSGRVLKVPVTVGTVVLAGEPIAQVAEQNFVLRMRVPERHARFLKVGDTIRIDGEELRQLGPRFGTVKLVYPQIEDGRVIADADVQGLGDNFVGERIRVWVSGGERTAFVIPSSFITTRFGVDYVRLRNADGSEVDVPVQRGRNLPRPEAPDGVEILSGVKPGDVLVRP